MTVSSEASVRVTPLTPVDERYLSSATVWAALRPTANLLLGPAAATPDGLDRQHLFELFGELADAFPRLRQRIMQPFLGVHSPAFVEDESFDLGWHVRFHPDVLAADAIPAAVLAGFHNGHMDPARPLWDVLIAHLTDGGAAMVLRFHHVIGDGMFGRAMVAALSRSAELRGAEAPRSARKQLRAPGNRAALSLASARALWDKTGSVSAAWQEVVHVPAHRRLRRVAARNLRPIRARRALRSGAVTASVHRREPLRVELDLSRVRRFARASGGGLGDFVVALLAATLSHAEPGRGPIRAVVPVAKRGRSTESSGNQVSVTCVELPAITDLAALIAQAKHQVSDAVARDSFPALQPGSWEAYATYLPAPPRPQPLLGRPIESIVAWPALDPRLERMAMMGTSTSTRLELAVMIGPAVGLRLGVEAVNDAIRELLAPLLEVAA